MTKNDISIAPEYYNRYIDLAEDGDLKELLPDGGIRLFLRDLELFSRLEDRVYATGKWTIKQIVQHLIDTERIFIGRAVRFARRDAGSVPLFDENSYADHAKVDQSSLRELMDEYQCLRQSTCYFFNKLTREDLLNEGVIGDNQRICVLAIGFIQIGHPIHHHRVISERYLPLLNN